MPILAAEPYLYPPSLLDQMSEPGHHRVSQWWALYTKPRVEKSLMRKLCAQERSFYCPMIRRPSKSLRGRSRVAHLPLFTSYVFLNGTESDRLAALSTGYVSRVLPIVDAASFIEQMSQVQHLLDSGLDVELAPHFDIGTRIMIKSGPLKGVSGYVTRIRNRSRFVIRVDFLQQGASTILDGWEIERL